MKTKPFGQFLGINNRLPDFALATKNGRWLRDAENVHIDGSGSPRRRKAATLIQALSAPHSLYTAADGRRYLVVGGSLFEVTLPSFSSSLRRLLMNNNPVRYAEDAGSLKTVMGYGYDILKTNKGNKRIKIILFVIFDRINLN